MKRKIFFTFCLLILCISLTGCSSNDSIMKAIHDDYNTPDFSYSKHDTKSAAAKAGIVWSDYDSKAKQHKYKEIAIDEEFITNYAEKYSAIELLDYLHSIQSTYCLVGTFVGEEPVLPHTDDEKMEVLERLSVINAIINTASEYNEYPITFDWEKVEQQHNGKGYYEAQKDILAEKSVSGVTGLVVTKDGTPIPKSSSKKQYIEIKHYGDWKLVHSWGDKYDGGQLGWEHGEFKDVLPSWQHYDDITVWYKEFAVFNTTPEQISSDKYTFQCFPLESNSTESKELMFKVNSFNYDGKGYSTIDFFKNVPTVNEQTLIRDDFHITNAEHPELTDAEKESVDKKYRGYYVLPRDSERDKLYIVIPKMNLILSQFRDMPEGYKYIWVWDAVLSFDKIGFEYEQGDFWKTGTITIDNDVVSIESDSSTDNGTLTKVDIDEKSLDDAIIQSTEYADNKDYFNAIVPLIPYADEAEVQDMIQGYVEIIKSENE